LAKERKHLALKNNLKFNSSIIQLETNKSITITQER
jgi:hypothetical protein